MKLGYPHMPTLAYGLPFSGRPIPPKLPLAFADMLPPMNYNVVKFQTEREDIDKARNFFAQAAIQHEAKYLFFWDEDVLVSPHALRELIYYAEQHPDCGVIAGIYCLKVPKPEPLVFAKPGAGPSWDWRVGEVFECAGVGMGCTLLRVAMFADLKKPWFKSMSDLSAYLDNIPFGEAWTEDLWFCKQVRESKKWKIYANGQLILPHIDVTTGKMYELPPDSKPMRHLVVKRGKLKILDIGSGGNPLRTNEGAVITCDVREGVGADYRCDFGRLPFATGEFDVVFSSHTLEHAGRNDTDDVLKEWVRVLKPAGELRLVVPNIAWAAERVMQGKIDVNVLNVLHGMQDYPENTHRSSFTPDTLRAAVKALGFKTIDIKLDGYNIMLRAWRTRRLAATNGKGVKKRR